MERLTIIEETKEFVKFECPHCGSGEIFINKRNPKQYGYCPLCGTAVINYVPLPHQEDLHKSNALVKVSVGG